MVGGLPDWIRLWCVMRQHHLRCWTYPEDVGRRMPIHSFDLTEVQGEGWRSCSGLELLLGMFTTIQYKTSRLH